MPNATKNSGKAKSRKSKDKTSEHSGHPKSRSIARMAIGGIVSVALAAIGVARYVGSVDNSVSISNSPNANVQTVTQSTKNDGTVSQNLIVGVVKDNAAINMIAPSAVPANDSTAMQNSKAKK
jgi:hypothetical protein